MTICTECAKDGKDKGFVLNIEEALDIVLDAPEEELEEDSIFLFRNASGVYCFVCLCRELSVCVNCLDVADEVFPDTRCEAVPYVCSDCLNTETRNHLYECYSTGCMTAGEFAQQEYEIEMMEKEWGAE
jgi:hypothetical protein